MSRRRRWIFAGIAAGVLVAAAASFAARIPFSSEVLRVRIISTLADRLDADVELGQVRLRLLPGLRAEGTNLAIRHKRRRDVPPLISVKSFAVEANLLGLWGRHVSHVRLDGLEIQIPPDRNDRKASDQDTASVELDRGPHLIQGRQVVVDTLEAPDARLVIIPRNPERPARVWQLHALRVTSVGANTEMPFATTLTNAVPPGEIETSGSFGPWHRDDPGHTPIAGRFTFEHADLSVFKGISGILSAKGSYTGSLERIDVNGQTDTPDFVVNVGGHPVPLKTIYHAIVDGTNGDTALKRIDASFLDTSFVAEGGVYVKQGVKGRTITLDITIDRGRLEDLMRLAVKTATPPMTGALKLATKFDLPPGDEDVVTKLRLNGQFDITAGRFTNAEVQQKINELSRRASARRLDAQKPQRVTSDFSGRFALGKGTLSLPALTFDVPGAVVELNGTYGLQRETIAFKGNLFMDAKLSQTTTGFKSLLLKVVDPIFRRDGRTRIPIKISGTRNAPSFGLDAGRVLSSK